MGAGANPTGYRSCQMCHYTCTSRDATHKVIYGGREYHVCKEHFDNPIGDPRKQDFGPAPDSGTETSRKSARETDHRVTAQCYTVLGVLAAAGPEGLIREEIFPLAEITNQAACGRLNTLKKHGLVVVDGERRAATTRKTQQVYRLAIYAKMRAPA